MEVANFKLQVEEYEKIVFIISSLQEKLKASAVILISRNGQEIAFIGEMVSLDRQSLSSLAASSLAATFGLAHLIGEKEFERVYHKGDQRSILINPAGELALLLFILDSEQKRKVDLKSLTQASLILEDILEKSNGRKESRAITDPPV